MVHNLWDCFGKHYAHLVRIDSKSRCPVLYFLRRKDLADLIPVTGGGSPATHDCACSPYPALVKREITPCTPPFRAKNSCRTFITSLGCCPCPPEPSSVPRIPLIVAPFASRPVAIQVADMHEQRPSWSTG